jgi:hypothetical protein
MADPRPSDEPAEMSVADPEGPSNSLGAAVDDDVDEQEVESFPASDAHSDWAGPRA